MAIVQGNLGLDLLQNTVDMPLGVTFRDSKDRPVHRWYPYVEGFSAPWVRNQLIHHCKWHTRVYDPFGGAGTTQLEASKMGLESYYSEINPFMAFVANTKVNAVIEAKADFHGFKSAIMSFVEYVKSEKFIVNSISTSLEQYETVFPKRDFFEDTHLRHLLHAKDIVSNFNFDSHIQSLILLAIASIAVDSSNMTRRADLRRRRPDEYKERVVNVPAALAAKLFEMIEDIASLPDIMKPTSLLDDDARFAAGRSDNSFGFVITSPPYLNGTNYIRNTKLELGLLGFIASENDLKTYRSKTVCGGISDVTKSRSNELIHLPFVEEVAQQLDMDAYDPRIPIMVRSYFADMYRVVESVYRMLESGGTFVLDIGDSKFCGVHIPTDQFINKIAESVGFDCVRQEVLARRYSRDKTELKQVGLVFRKPV